VIDVIRATSTIVEALAAGARAVYPTGSTEEAIRMANSLGRDDTLLCGERKGLKIPGFHLGNSPSEFTPENVGGMRLVMNTTNGTRAFLAAAGADRVIAASLLNLTAVVDSVRGAERIALVCAGRDGKFSLDDALCAGVILRELSSGGDVEGWDLDDASRAALTIAAEFKPDLALLRSTGAGAALVEVGLEADLSHCASRDRHDVVPEMSDRTIRIPGKGS